MSIEVRVPKEITEYKEKIIFGLSIRQLLCFTIAIIIGVGTYFFTNKYFGQDIASYLVIFEVMPIFAVGFIKKNGFTFEKYAALMIRHMFGISRREYRTYLLIDEINLPKESEGEREKVKKRGVEDVTATKIKENKNRNKKRRECEGFEITAKGRKRKSKEALREIKAAEQDYRRKKQTDKKAAEKRIGSQNSTANNQI